MIKNALGAVLAGAALLATATPAAPGAAPEARWERVGDGITSGISGLAVAGVRHGTADLLAVRDNKKPGENRLVALRHRPGDRTWQRPVAWAGAQPVDLEAIDAVPGRPHEYVALSSAGTAYRLHWDGDHARVLAAFPVPGIAAGDNYEGFALAPARGGRLLAVWADRGQDDRPATLSAAAWDPRDNTFGPRTSAEFRVPYPAADVRHVSDVEVSPSGRVTVSSASDPGDDGPYDSALYDAGRVAAGPGDRVRLTAGRAPRRLATFPGHKIEALACLPGSRAGVVGTDDENAGGSLAATDACRP
ncbi:hypothetical protein [Streptomyces sp. NPDC015131]|uniref:hypothetical protein n=1 Tax=Streptomyces sp. NPDC015131 TaxID=3364941 RepID=UPI0036FA65F5